MKKFHIVLDEATHRQLKSMASAYGLTIGGLVRALLAFSGSSRFIKDEQFQARFAELLKAEIKSVGGTIDEPSATFYPKKDGAVIERVGSVE